MNYHAAIDAEDWGRLEQQCLQRLKRKPKDHLAHHHLCLALIKSGKRLEAINRYQAALKLWPKDAEFLVNCANQLIAMDRIDEALPMVVAACQIRPNHGYPWALLAQVHYRLCDYENGLSAANNAFHAARSREELVAALTQRSIHRRELGQIKEAVLDSEAAIGLVPTDVANHVNRMLFMLADPSRSIQDVARAAKEFARIAESPYLGHWPTFSHLRHGPWRRLRIAFISGDFRNHSVMYFIEGLLAQLDRRQFEVHAYYLHEYEDEVTQRVRAHVDVFSKIAGADADTQCKIIREGNIDIAIDLAGHTGHSGIMAMARKVAPIQISWLGFPATTGLQSVDYKFSDDVTDPQGADDQYSETLYRLPTFFCCYRPLIRYPLYRYQPAYQVAQTPALRNGYITFGSSNNLGKLTDEVLRTWGVILKKVPNARLLIEGKNLEKDSIALRYKKRCEKLGIDSDRLDLLGLHTANQYLTYHKVDIALDPFPLTGGTTSFDVVWMGVPLVSLEGDSFKSRLSTGILSKLDHKEWLAKTTVEYVSIACQLAADHEKLNAIRQHLRSEVEQSVLMREDVFCQHYGEGLRVMWLKWLAQGQHPDDETAQDQLMQSWITDMPAQWQTPAEPGVGLEPGKRVSLTEAHAMLETLLHEAQREGVPSKSCADGQISSQAWADVTKFATTILNALPHDPVALAVLAEVEHAHGHTSFALTYLQYAQQALLKQLH